MEHAIRVAITTDTLDALRAQLNVGDAVKETVIIETGGRHHTITKRVTRRITRKHAHLVELESDGLPVHTMTYKEIIMDRLGMKGE